MKKILLALCLLSVCSSAFAYIQEDKMVDINRLMMQGYSEDALRILDRANMRATGDDEIYNVYYQDKVYKNKWSKWYDQAKRYWDPLAEDDNFARYDIKFENRFYTLDPNPNKGTILEDL